MPVFLDTLRKEEMAHQKQLEVELSAVLTRLHENENRIALTTRELALSLGTSKTWLEIRRGRGGGPPFVRLGPGIVRYRLADVLAWLDTLLHSSTAEYEKYQKGNMSGRRGRAST